VPSETILAVDQGSSSTRCVAYDRHLTRLGAASRQVGIDRTGPGMVEHDPDALLAGALEAVSEIVGQGHGDVGGIGIASQTESFVVWDRSTGQPAIPVVSWQDQRAEERCRALAGRPEAAFVRAKTGLGLDSTFSAPKLGWLFERDATLRRRAETGELAFGDVACWLAWHLTGGVEHVTEPSNACRSLLVDLATRRWDGRLLELFGVPEPVLPQIRPSDAIGLVASTPSLGFEAPLQAMLGDQPAALYGQGCTSEGLATLTIGTGAFVWLNVGSARPEPPPGVLATVAWEKRAAGPTYALEAYGANAGNAFGLYPDLGFPPADTLEALDWSRPHPVVVMAPAGLGTPLWHGADRLTVLGASSRTTPADLAAAALAGVAHQIADALGALDHDGSADSLRVGGGLSAHGALLQAVADLSGRVLEVAADPEATARGIATLAAEAVGLLDGEALAPAIARRIDPRLDDDGRTRERSRWQEALDVHVQTGT
jgi:glycerol kinase